MLGWLLRRGERRPRPRLAGCLLWILALIVLLIVLSLLFGGFQKGTKAAGAGPRGAGPRVVPSASQARPA